MSTRHAWWRALPLLWIDSVNTSSRLRVGIMLDSLAGSAWIGKIIRDIRTSDFAELSLVILNLDKPKPKPPIWKRLLTFDVSPQARRGALFYFYSLIDERLFRNRVDAFQIVDLGELCSGVETIRVMPEKKKFTDRFTKTDIDAILARDLDVILRIGFRIIRGEILATARHGVWSFHHGDNLAYRGAPALFWEMCEQNPVSGVVLQILTEELDGGRVIYRSLAATDFTSLSRQRNPIYWKASNFVLRRLRDLRDRGWSYIESLPTFHEPPESLGKIYYKPSNRQMLPFLWRTVVTHNLRRVWRTRVDSWSLAWRKRGDPSKILSGKFDPHGFQFIRPPADRYYADPCAIAVGGRTFVFFEDFRFGEQKGVVSCLELSESGPGKVETVLTLPYHLSYPFLFEWNSDVFMVPETGENRTVELYKAVDFPRRWELSRVLLKGVEAVDATLLYRENRWWMFANIKIEGGMALDELHLFYADGLDQEWTGHPNNPVVSDVRNARPAGRIFEVDGQLIRPAQDCTVTYGRAVSFQKITVLSTDDYREETVNRIDAPIELGFTGVHTYTFTDDFEIIDVKREVRRNSSNRPTRRAAK
jgi:hypothetical protein